MGSHGEIEKYDRFIILKDAGIKFLRGMWKRLFLKEVHGLFFVGRQVRISHGRHIRCGSRVKFEDYAEIQGLCLDGLRFGNKVTIGRGVMIRPSSYYGGYIGNGLTVGDNSSIGPHGYIGCSGKVIIGKNVMIGPKCSLFAENHVFADKAMPIKSQGTIRKGITIEDDCWIGSNVTILDGVKVGYGSVIGAGTLVTKDVPEKSIVMDRRYKEIRKR